MNPIDCLHQDQEPVRRFEAPDRIPSRSPTRRRTARTIAVAPALLAMLFAGVSSGCLAPAGEERADEPTTTATQDPIAARATSPAPQSADMAGPTSTEAASGAGASDAGAEPGTEEATGTPDRASDTTAAADDSTPKDAREALLERLQGGNTDGETRALRARNPNAGLAGTALDGRAFAETRAADGPRERPRARRGEKAENEEAARITGPEAEKLAKSAEEFARNFASRLHAGDEEGLAKLFVTDDDLRKALSPGVYDILSASQILTNEKHLKNLLEAARGSVRSHVFKPGTLVRTRVDSLIIWVIEVPLMSKAVLQLDLGGAPLIVTFNQLLYLDGEWKVFGLE